eukprot:3105814-Amphidinium_carterae.1
MSKQTQRAQAWKTSYMSPARTSSTMTMSQPLWEEQLSARVAALHAHTHTHQALRCCKVAIPNLGDK